MKISLLMIPALIAAAVTGHIKEYVLMFAILAIHELAHLCAVRKREVEISGIKAEPFGIRITLSDDILKDPRDEIFIAAAGPFFSVATGLGAYLICQSRGAFNANASYFSASSLALGFFNLLPVYPADGGRILRAYLSLKTGYVKSYNTVRRITAFFSAALIAAGLYIIYITRFNFTLCLIGCFLYYGLLTEKDHTARYLNRELAEYPTKSAGIEKAPVIRVAVNKNFKARRIISEMSFNRYCIAEIIDGYKKIGELTEGELLNALIKYGGDVRVSDIIYKNQTV